MFYAYTILYDNGVGEVLVDSEPNPAPVAVGSRHFMPRQAQCASTGWYTVTARVAHDHCPRVA